MRIHYMKVFLVTIFSLLFYSCETEGQITGANIEPDQDEYLISDLDPLGGDILGHVGELYYNLLRNENYEQEFYKYDFITIDQGNYSGDVLTLKTYNSSYYIPPNAFTDNPDTIVMVYDYTTDSYSIS